MTTAAARRAVAEAGLPQGFALVLDRSTRRYDNVLVGGTSLRAMRLSPAGHQALAALQAGRAVSPAARVLGARLVAAGLAHPIPLPSVKAPSLTIAIPTHNRPTDLDRALAAVRDRIQTSPAPPPGDSPRAGGRRTDVRDDVQAHVRMGNSGCPSMLTRHTDVRDDVQRLLVVDDGSDDAQAIAAICRRHGAELIRHDTPRGPAAARNAALDAADTELVAFLDDDCVAPPNWTDDLARHFADPQVAAVAPRIRPRATGYARQRSPLDLGPHPAQVQPHGRVGYVPSAALLLRKGTARFDEALRYGEDVDLVWRLHDAGHVVRYDPRTEVEHQEPDTAIGLLKRRYHYGRSAGPLARRHKQRLAPIANLKPFPTVAAVAAIAARPATALALAATATLPAARKLTDSGIPTHQIPVLGIRATASTLTGLAHAAATVGAPITALALAHRRTRRPAIVLTIVHVAGELMRNQPQRTRPSHVVATLADDAAYGLGVWRGALESRTCDPLRPVLTPGRERP